MSRNSRHSRREEVFPLETITEHEKKDRETGTESGPFVEDLIRSRQAARLDSVQSRQLTTLETGTLIEESIQSRQSNRLDLTSCTERQDLNEKPRPFRQNSQMELLSTSQRNMNRVSGLCVVRRYIWYI